MSDEQERLKKLRDKQVAARDPHIKTRAQQHFLAEREGKRDKSLSIEKIMSVIPHLWRMALYGLILGVLGLLVLPAIWESPLALPVAFALLAIEVVLGAVIGNALDMRDELRNLTK
jgi:hypothetical protein